MNKSPRKPACGHWMPRAKTTCLRQEGHRGAHRAKVWFCDGCDKPQIGFPAAKDNEAGVWMCFMCQLDDAKYYGLIPKRKRTFPQPPSNSNEVG